MTAPKPNPPTEKLPWRSERLLWVALALLLRLPKVAANEPWLDEACSLELAGQGPIGLLTTLATSDASPHPPLFFTLLSFVTGLLGEGLGPARLLSLVAGAAMVVLSAEAGRRLFGRGAGRLAALLTAIAPLAIHYGVEIRGYGLLSALCLGATLLLHDALHERRPLWQPAFVFGLATLTHYYALSLLCLPLLLGVGAIPRQRWSRALLSFAVAAVPSAALAAAQLSRGAGGGGWIPGFEFSALLDSLAAFSVGTRLPRHLGHAGMLRPPQWSHLGGMLFVVVGLLASLRVPERSPGLRRALWALMGVAWLTPAVGSLWRPMYLAGRYELAAMVPLHVLVASGWLYLVGLIALPGRTQALVLGGAVLLLSSMTLPRYLTLQTQQPFAFIGMQVLRQDTPKTVVISTDLTAPATDWQLRQGAFEGASLVFPEEQARHRCWKAPPASVEALAEQARGLLAGLRKADVRQLFVTATLRRKRPTRAALVLMNTLTQSGWVHRGSRSMGPYGVSRFTRRR